MTFPSFAALLASALLLCACAGVRLTPYSAGERAARLANDRCQERYGSRPFLSDDFEAEFIEGRWTWGGETGQEVDGFYAEVSFDPDGGRPRVEVNRDEERGNPDGF